MGLLAFSAPYSWAAEEGETHEITILADVALQSPLVELARLHARTYSIPVNVWFKNTAELVEAIRDGADADLVITADAQALQALTNLGQIDVYATKTIATCPLVVAVVTDAAKTKRGITLELLGLTLRNTKPLTLVTIASRNSSENEMSALALARSEIFKDRTVRIIASQNVEDAKRNMKRYNAPALLLATDVFSDTSLSLLQRFPSNIVPPAEYKAAVLAGDAMKDSRQFITSLGSEPYRNILERYGLATPEASAP